MCGRYDLSASAEELAARFGVPLRDLLNAVLNMEGGGAPASDAGKARQQWQPRYNIAPRQHNPVVVMDSGGQNRLEMMQWGLVPSWAKEVKASYATINARAETVASKPTFRKPLASQRCLVPATGYFEWVEGGQEGTSASSGRGKQPYRIQLQDGNTEADNSLDRIFAFAGLYDIWRSPGGEELKTYTIVTTGANDALRAIHSRMPVILPRDLEGDWLDQNNRDIEKLISMLQPYSEQGLAAYPVSTLVNSPTNEGRELIEPVAL